MTDHGLAAMCGNGQQQGDASFLGLSIALGGSIVRLQQNVRYAGPGGSAELLGAFLASDEQFQEFRIFVDHNEPHCVSNVVFKGALSGAQAHTVWIGDVLVRREAVGIETYELNRNLLLNDGPRADSVPNLELETGDVVSAGHASATGRSMTSSCSAVTGINEELARQLVVEASSSTFSTGHRCRSARDIRRTKSASGWMRSSNS